MALIGHAVIYILTDHFSILGNDKSGLPFASLASVTLYLFHARSQGRILLIGWCRRIGLAELGGLQRVGFAILKNRNSVNGNCAGLIIIACTDADGCTRVVHKFVIRAAPAYGCIRSGCNIGRFKGMRTTHGSFKTCFYHCIIQGRGNLAYTASDLLYNLSVVISRCRLIALCFGSLSYPVVEGKFLSGLKDDSIDCLCRQLHIGISLLIRCCICGKGSDRLIFFSCCCFRKFRLCFVHSCRNDCAEILAA